MRAHNVGSRSIAAFGSALILFAIGCNGPAADNAGDVELQSSAVSNPTTPVTKAATVKPPPSAGKAANPTVWVVMKSQANAAAAGKGKDWKSKGQAVVNALTSNATASQASLKTFLASRAAKFKSFWIVNTVKVTADQATIDEIAKRSDVAKVIPDRTFSLPPLQPNAAGVNVVEWNLDNIHAPAVWNQFGARGDGIIVANIDTGVQFDHPALVRQYRGNLGNGSFDHNYNWFDPASVCGFPSAPCDNVFHGTHTMGTMVGDDQAGNQIGVAPAAKWIAAKGCETNSCSFDSLLSAGQWVLAPTDLNNANPRPDLRPHIVNNSWGGGPGDPFYQATVQAWVAAGIFPAFANGNAGPSCGSAGSPGDYPESYAVGAYDISNFLAFFSSRGPSGLDGGIKPNISAPGVNVRSSVPGNGYDIFSGTSMATPHVAGSVALLWSGAPSLIGDIAGTRAILDQTAIDTSDLSCGGSPENNNAFGQGRLDILAAMNLAPTGPTGFVDGTVTGAGGLPVAGASIHAVGSAADRTTVSGSEGGYHLRLPVGSYALTVSAFGYVTQTIPNVNVTQDATTTQNVALVAVPSFRLSGTVVDSTGIPVVGGQVSVVGTPLPPAVTDAAGHYSFPLVPAGTYDVTGSAPGACYAPAGAQVTLSADTTQNFTLQLEVDGFGYVCRLTTSDYLQANTPTGLFGDDVLTTVSLPFNFPYYSSSFSAVNITTNGFANFTPTAPFFGNQQIPDPSEPNAAIYPFWDDLFADDLTVIATDTFGTAPNRVFVIEWRDVSPLGRPDLRMSFEVQLGEGGSIVTRYQNVGPDPFQSGASASVGIEDETGTTGIGFAFLQPILTNNLTVAYTLPPSGFVRGTITDTNDQKAIPGATVRALQGTTVVRQVSTDGNGGYSLHLPVGAYTIEATATNYSVEHTSVNVTLNANLTANLALKTGRATLSPSNIQLTVPPNQTRTRTLTLQNTGSATLSFTVNESGGARQSTVSTARLAKNPTFNVNAKDTRTMFAPGILATGMAPLAAGDVIKSFPPTGVGFAWGVGMTTNLWLSDINTPFRDVEFTTDGTATGRQFLTPWVNAFGADMAYVPSRGLICQVNVGGDNGIYCMDPASGNVVSSITGPFQWTNTSQRGLAYRSDDDSFYIGGWNEGIVYHIAGLGSSQPGQVLGTCMPGDGAISGLAYNSAAGVLWAATNSPSDTIYELNPTDCTVLSTLAHPQPGFQGGGLEMDEAGNLWMIAQSPNRVFLVDSGVPAFNDVPWLSVSPTTGTVATGKQQALTVTIDTHGLTPGLYLATVFVGTTAAKQPMLRVPVSLYVPDYQQSVNAGGSNYVDTLGDTWAADKKWAAGSWGFVQKGKTDSTTKTIKNTVEQTLFRSQHVDPYAYRFDNVPNGTYQIELGFAEFNANEKIGKRLFDVIVEDSLILPAHDIVYQVGTLTAENRTFFLNITDGQMDIRLVPRAGSDPPVINAARITHRTDR